MERKSLADAVSSLTSGRLRYAVTELSTLPRAGVVVEDRYSRVFTLERVHPAQVADGLAELQVRWTYRFLAPAFAWAETEPLATARIGLDDPLVTPGGRPEPATAEVRAWALSQGLPVADRGRLRPEVLRAWHEARGG